MRRTFRVLHERYDHSVITTVHPPAHHSAWNGIMLDLDAERCLDEIALLVPMLTPGYRVQITCTGSRGGQDWEYTIPTPEEES